MQIELSETQRDALENIWFVYGNNGKKHSITDHNSIKYLLEGVDVKLPLPFSDECRAAVTKIIDLDIAEEQSKIKAGDSVFYITKRGEKIFAQVLDVFPKKVRITGDFQSAAKILLVSKLKVEKRKTDS